MIVDRIEPHRPTDPLVVLGELGGLHGAADAERFAALEATPAHHLAGLDPDFTH